METLKKGIGTVHKKAVVPFFDMILGKTMSKKLMVFAMASILILYSHIDGTEWIEVAKWYFGAQGAVDIAETVTGNYKRKSNLDS